MVPLHLSPEFVATRARLADATLASVGAAVIVFDASARAVWADANARAILATPSLEGSRLADLGWQERGWQGTTGAGCPIDRVVTTGEPIRCVLVGAPGSPTRRPELTLTAVPYGDQLGTPCAVMASVVSRRTARPGEHDHVTPHPVSDQSLIAQVLISRTGEILDWNQRFLDLSGQCDESVVNARFESFLDLDWGWVLAALEHGDGTSVVGRTWLVRTPGAETSVVGNFRQIWDPGGDRAVLVELLDPTEFLDPPDARLGMLGSAGFRLAAIPMLAVTIAGDIVEANASAAMLLDASAEILRQDPLSRHVHMDRSTWEAAASRAWHGERRVELDGAIHRTGRRAERGGDGRVTVVLDQVHDGSQLPVLLAQIVPTLLPHQVGAR